MKLRYLRVITAVGLATLFIALVCRVLRTEPLLPSAKKSNIRYRFTVTNETERALPNLALEFFAPAIASASQQTELLDASEQFSVKDGEHQNQDIVITTFLPPYGTKAISLSASIALWEAPRPEIIGPSHRFLAPELWVESDAPPISALASNLKRDSVRATSASIHEWIAKNIEREPFTKYERGALYALQKKSGDCTEHAYLFVALARAAGVPARAVSGFVVTRDQVLKPSEYHNWAEFHDGQTWRIADPHRNAFDSEYAHYVKFRNLGGSSSSAFAESAKRFSAVNTPGIAIRME